MLSFSFLLIGFVSIVLLVLSIKPTPGIPPTSCMLCDVRACFHEPLLSEAARSMTVLLHYSSAAQSALHWPHMIPSFLYMSVEATHII